MRAGLPEDVWARWSKPENESIRQAVVAFGGNTRTEAVIDSFPEVSILTDSTSGPTKGVIYLTTKRFVFLPRNSLIHRLVCEAEFDSLRTLSGLRSDLSISLVDANGAVAKFTFVSQQSLFGCFNQLRRLAEASRLDEAKFVEACNAVARANRDDKPFSSIEVELQECTQTVEIVADAVEQKEEIPPDPLAEELLPVKQLYDRCNSTHLDIHLKLRLLLAMSFVSFCLKFMPFLPFCALSMVGLLLFTAWGSINRDLDDVEEAPYVVPKTVEGFVKTRKFIREWIFWEKPRNGMMVMEAAGAVLLGWIILPSKLYRIACFVAYVIFLVIPIFKEDRFYMICSGPWFSS